MRLLKQISTISISIIIIIYGCWFWFQKNTHETFIERKAKADLLWDEFKTELENRDKYFIEVRKNENFDSIRYFIMKSRNEREGKENTFKIVQNEYRLNKSMMHYYPNEDIWVIYNSLNSKKEKYNAAVKSFNSFYFKFPNSLVARKYSFKTLKRFDLNYGIKNNDPMIKSKELPEWSKDIDTLKI